MLSVVFLLIAGQIAGTPTAKAELLNPQGKKVGVVKIFKVKGGGTLFDVSVLVPSGWHAFHIHEKGECRPPDFRSAGGHWNPDRKKHGFLTEGGPHKGDLPNFYSTGDRARFHIFAPHIEAEEILGKAIVIHEKPDDYVSQPAGNAGKRIACGVIRKPEK